ncbi:MAG: caspase family protein [Chlorobia bacterium]|nr:caspase family protein [Fimbriimonadaceae bacterium]
MLLEKGQTSRETFHFLNSIYTTLGETAKRQALEAKYSQIGGKATFRVDNEVVSPEEKAAIDGMAGGNTNTVPVKVIPKTDPGKPADPTRVGPGGINPGISLNPIVGPVPVIETKFALIIGNGDSRMKDMALPFAADDAQQLREALVANAGYSEQNIDLVLNATAEQIRKSAEALAQRVDENATVLIYFSGVGTNIGGKDFMAGVDSENVMDSVTMVAKSELFNQFLAKGAKVFSFFQVHRTITNGRYFGAEVPMIGQLSQMQASIPGANVQAYIQNGKNVGLFTKSMIRVLAEQRSNQLPILEFGWQVFNKMRRGDSGTTGGSSQQSCTLPVLTNLASDARF